VRQQVSSALKKQDLTDSILVLLLIANTAFPFFYRPIESIILSFLFLAYVFVRRGISLQGVRIEIMLFLILFVSILLIKVILKNVTVLVFSGIILRIIYAYLVLIVLKDKLLPRFVTVMYYITLVSFFFYFTSLASPKLLDFYKDVLSPLVARYFPFNQGGGAYKNGYNILIYDFGQSEYLRNSGPFWEPGAFGGFLLLALFLNAFHAPKIFDKKGSTFVVGLITTLSTTAYLALFIFLLYYFLFYRRNFIVVTIVFPFFILLAVALYSNVSFLNKKIKDHLTEIDRGDRITAKTRKTRFVSFLLDFNATLESPLMGSLENEKVMAGSKIDFREHRTNGLGSLLRKYGFIFFIYYFCLLYVSFNKMCLYYGQKRSLAYFGVALVLIIGFSEDYFGLIFFWCLPLWSIVYPRALAFDRSHDQTVKRFQLVNLKNER